ncbi:MAG: TonB-dependent receptor [Gammaproteobacteria bacterium]|nr:TonB-dependent receptor [Gammaproteobacteria bacterium]
MKLSRIALAVALAPSLVLAAELPEPTSAAQLPSTVITRATNLKAPTPASVAVIDREQIERSAATDLLDLLGSQAGVQIRDTMGDGNRASLSLRGFGENAMNNTLVLVDGRRLNQPTLSGPDLNSVPLANIERIEIIRGAGTVLYGDQAVGGVVNIITRTPMSNEVYIEAVHGSHDLKAYRGHIHQQLGGGFSLYASGESRTNDNYRDHNEANYDNAFARLRYQHETGHVLYEYQTVDDELRFPNALPLAQRREDRKQSVGAQAWNDSKSQVHRIALEQSLGDIWSTHLDYSHSDQDGVGSFGPGSEFAQGTRIETISPRLTARFDSPLGSAEWLLGHDHITSDYEYLAPWGDTLARQKLRDWYTQYSQNLGSGVDLVLGFRTSEVDDDTTALANSYRDRENSTSVGLSWQANDQTRLFLRREDVLRWANVDENGFIPLTINRLKPQTGESWETGVEWVDGLQQYRLSVYRLELENELMYDPTAEGPNSAWGFDGANINLDKTLRQGLMLEAERQLTPELSIGGQYSFTDSEYRDGAFKGKEVPWVSRHSASAHVSYEILPGLRSYVEAIYTGNRYHTGDDANILGKTGSYTLFNAALSYDYRQFNAKLRINNLTGKRYDAFGSFANRYPAPEEEYQLSVGYRF